MWKRNLAFLNVIPLLALFVLLTSCNANQQEIDFVFMRRTAGTTTTDEYWQRVAQAYQTVHPGVKVNLHIFDWDKGPDAIEEMINAGTPPDVIHVATRDLGGYIAKGWVEPIDSYMTPEFRASFYPRVLNASAQYEGRTFGLPVSVTTRVLYYNKDLFARAGVSAPPQNWDELREISLKISQLGPDIHGLGLQGSGKETDLYFYYFLAGNGGGVLSPDSTRATFNRAEGIAALQYLQELIRLGAISPDPGQYDKDSLRQAFIDGRLGMVISSDSLAEKLKKAGNPFEYGLAPIPFQSTPAVIGVTDSLTIFSKSDNRDLAWSFLEFAFQDEYRLEYALNEGYLPEKIAVAEQYQKQLSENTFFMEQLPQARFAPMNVKSAEIASIISETLLSVYRGEVDAQTALDMAAAKINELLAYSATSW